MSILDCAEIISCSLQKITEFANPCSKILEFWNKAENQCAWKDLSKSETSNFDQMDQVSQQKKLVDSWGVFEKPPMRWWVSDKGLCASKKKTREKDRGRVIKLFVNEETAMLSRKMLKNWRLQKDMERRSSSVGGGSLLRLSLNYLFPTRHHSPTHSDDYHHEWSKLLGPENI